MKGKRVQMLVGDAWAEPGWIGTIAEISYNFTNVRIKWDNGKSLMHSFKNMILLDEEGDPNVAFLIRKHSKKGKIL